MKALHIIALVLLVVGGVNWGLVGLGNFMNADWNVVHLLVGSWPSLESIVYILVGLSAIKVAVSHRSECTECKA